MSRKIAILRGINVGGRRKVLMADLKSLCESKGLKNVKTYIQSGNVLFDSEIEDSALEAMLEKAITDQFGFDVPVLVRTEKEFETSIKNNPFFDKNTDIKQLHLTFLKEKPNKENIEKIVSQDYTPDQFKIIDNDIFILCLGKYHQSKLTNNFFENKLQVGATTRNWKTVLKLLEISKNYDS